MRISERCDLLLVYLLLLVFVFEFSMEFTCGFECATSCHTIHWTVRKIFRTYLHCDAFINSSSNGSRSNSGSVDEWDTKNECWHFNGLPFRDSMHNPQFKVIHSQQQRKNAVGLFLYLFHFIDAKVYIISYTKEKPLYL